ncbi:hypothetical protein EDB87DRAFT_697602 [Lactarius vividus]|nr:hypothetical protein EDB87DRAFT_697602 [Lactarius vividus]
MSSFESNHSIGETSTSLFAFILVTILVSKRRVHWSLYPTGPNWRRFPEEASNELLGALISSGIDSLTSKVSTSPFTVAEMEYMRDFIKEAKSLGTENPHVISSVGNKGLFRFVDPETLSFSFPARLLSFYGFCTFMGKKILVRIAPKVSTSASARYLFEYSPQYCSSSRMPIYGNFRNCGWTK